MTRLADAVALVAGAASAVLVDAVGRRVLPGRSVVAGGAGLVVAAAIYPAARRESRPDAALVRELLVLAGASVLGVGAARSSSRLARFAVAAGWALHPVFDYGHTRTGDSRLPDWYAPLCAGYDVAYAALLARRP
ncbi:MAG: hypothetical protein ACTHMS_21670 [Jatrophihabitans sp.]|uniref:hypothetical protein n=1 Tax=Jatrophihabitans sp. TaxID=1932789 RepID=UPI003F7D9807